MEKRYFMQAAVLLGVLSLPTFASAEGGLLGTAVKNSTNLVEDTKEEIIEPTILIEPEHLVTTIDESMPKATQTVTEIVTKTVGVEQPLVEKNLLQEPSFEVKTGLVEAEVSKTSLLKVETSDTKIEVSDSLNIEVDTEVEKTKVSVQPIDRPTEPITKLNLKPELYQMFEYLEEEREAPKKQNFVVENQTIYVETRPSPKHQKSDFEKLKVIPIFQPGPYTKINSSSGSANMVMAVLNSVVNEDVSGSFSYFGKGRTYFDQWLNAPPSQPPQESLFTISRI